MQTFSYSLLGTPLEEMVDQERFPVSFKTIKEEIPLVFFYLMKKNAVNHPGIPSCVYIFYISLFSLNALVSNFKL